MTNKIKENILIFWGGLAICLFIADSFGWIDISQWLQQVINYDYTYEKTARMVFPVLFTILVLVGIAKIIIVSYQIGRLSSPSIPNNDKQEVKLLPSLPLEELSSTEPPTDTFTCLEAPKTI